MQSMSTDDAIICSRLSSSLDAANNTDAGKHALVQTVLKMDRAFLDTVSLALGSIHTSVTSLIVLSSPHFELREDFPKASVAQL